MEVQTLTFSLERETKNTIRYAEQTAGKPPAVGTVYVQKWAMGQNPPKTLRGKNSGPDLFWNRRKLPR